MAFQITGEGTYRRRNGDAVYIKARKNSTHSSYKWECVFYTYTDLGEQLQFQINDLDIVGLIGLEAIMPTPTNKVLLIINKKRRA